MFLKEPNLLICSEMRRGETKALNQTAKVALPAAWYAASSLAHEATLRQQLFSGKRADEKMKPEELNSDRGAAALTKSVTCGWACPVMP